MTAGPGRYRRLAVRLAQHASRVLRTGRSPWADAMRHELDYIEDDAAAFRWSLGCVLASYRSRLAHLRTLSTPAAWRHVAASGVLVLLIGVALQGHASGQTEPPRPVFDEATCDLPNVSLEVRPRLRCGTVSVPRDYANPDAGQFKLAVVVIQSTQTPSLPDPVVYISGGPGEPLTIFADYQARHPYAQGRDLILVDQRGTGRSEPNLCPDTYSKLRDAALAAVVDATEETLATRRATYLACRDEAIRHGIALTDFGTRVTVEDFEWVRQALGVAHWNVYGESYGTTVAMTLVALHPDAIRSVVLDSVYPPDPKPLRSAIVADALDAFFAYCAGEKLCSTSFPDLAGTYRETLDRLGRNPLIVSVPPALHRPNDDVRLTGSLFELLVDNLIYYPMAYPSLPRLIKAVHDGDVSGLATIFASQLAEAATGNRATNAAVDCRDRPSFRDPLPAAANVLDRMQLYGVCDGWSDLGPPPLVPNNTAVPTLVLSGQFDPVAGPSFSHHIAELIGNNARWVEFPLIGHNVRHFSPCGTTVVAEFIDKPSQAPDTSCADRTPPIVFAPKSQTP
jgi:pimeloyl-ACP methyl ester carboxylesterase